MHKAVCSEMQLDLFEICGVPVGGDTQDFSYGRTYPETSRLTRDWIFEPCLKKSDRLQFQCLKVENGQTQGWQNCQRVISHGEYWMLNIGASPSVAEESFLSQILQAEVPEKYYLSAKACLGILRRAEKRGKELPPELKAALEAQASCECVQESPEAEKAHLSAEREA